MPQQVDVSGVGLVDFPDDMSSEDIKSALDESFAGKPQTSAAGAAGRGFLGGLAPSAAAVGTAGVIAEVLGAPETLGASLAMIPPTIAAAWGAGKLQEKAIHAVAPEFEKLQQADIEQHPWATTAGAVASAAPFARVTPGAILNPRQVVVPAALGGTVGAAIPLAEGRRPTAQDIAGGVASATLFGAPRFSLLPRSRAAAVSTLREAVEPPQGVAEAEELPPSSSESPQIKTRPGPTVSEVAPQKPPVSESDAYLEAERKAIDEPVEVTDTLPDGQPFAGKIATIDRKSGRILVNAYEFPMWLKEIPPERRQQAVRSLLSEERIHLGVDDEAAGEYWDSLTRLEKAIERRRYTGEWSGKEVAGRPIDLSDTDFGHEAVRFRLQQLARMEPREIVEAVGKERWKLKSLTALEDVVRGLRETVGTKASTEGKAILSRIQTNLDAAKAVAGGAPAALRKALPAEEEMAAQSIERLKDELARAVHSGDREGATKIQADIDGLSAKYPGALERSFPAALRKGKKEPGQKEFYLPPVVKGRPVERSVDVNVPPEAKRLKITPQDIGWEQPSMQPWRPISSSETRNRGELAKTLTKDSRIEGSNAPESLSRRLTVLLNKRDGTVHLVSTYPHSRNGAMLLNPENPTAARPHQTLGEMLNKYKPLFSVLTREPRQRFHQAFDNLEDFYTRFGDQAIQMAGQRIGPEHVEQGVEGVDPATGTPNIVPTTQPAVYGREQAGREPATDLELRAFHDFFGGETPSSPQAMRRELSRATAEANRQMVSGLKKAIQHEMAASPGITPPEALSRALDKFYEDLTQTEDRTGFLKRAMGRLNPPSAQGDRQTGPAAPAALRKAKQAALDEFTGLLGTIRGVIARHTTKQDLSRLRDRAQILAADVSEKAKREVGLASASKSQPMGNPEILSAARAVNSSFSVHARPTPETAQWASPGVSAISHPDPAQFGTMLQHARNGQAKADQLLAAPTPQTLQSLGLSDLVGLNSRQIEKVARAWKEAAANLEKEVQYAEAHFGDPELMDTTLRLRREQNEQLTREHEAGIETKEVENYLQGLYEGEMWGDDAVHFGGVPALGRMFGKPKTFANYYEAIDAGPFVPKSNNVSDIAAHRIKSGMNKILQKQSFNAALDINDPKTNTPVAIEPQPSPDGGFQIPPGQEQRVLVYRPSGGKPLAVRRGYSRLLENLYGDSAVPDWVGGKAALAATGMLKHGFLLVADTFHLGRITDYAVSIMGKKAGWKGGYSALEFRPENMAEAVRKGVIPQSAADWALGTENLTINGEARAVPRYEIGRMLQNEGLNVGGQQDAIQKHLVDNWDVTVAGKEYGAGAYNRLLFDKITRGLMLQSGVNEFTRLNRANPGADATKLMRRVVSDTNTFYGSLGRQGLIKSPTARDLANMVFLAPQWVESLLRKEAQFMGRAVSAPYKLLTEGPAAANIEWGTIGKGIGRGLVAMFLATQGINLITRHKTTFQNPEDGHELDAWIPSFDGSKEGFWISPMAVFMEVMHDVLRLGETKPKAWDTIRQIGENKLGPFGRMFAVLATGRGPTGEQYTSTGGVLKAAAAQAAPIPISFGRFGQAALHKLFPGVPPPPAGSLERQMLSTAGIKSEPASGATAQIAQKARRFMASSGLQKETGWVEQQTDEASYSRLRGALRNGDERGAARVFEALKKNRPESQIIKGMQSWAKKGFTGSRKTERLFLYSLTEPERDLYTKASLQKMAELQAFYDFYLRKP